MLIVLQCAGESAEKPYAGSWEGGGGGKTGV